MRTAGNIFLPAVQPWADSAQLQRLAAKKHFVFAPTPLLRWLWGLGLSQTSERLFLVYWEDACSRSAGQYLTARLSVSLAATLIGSSEAAVKKANRQLLEAGVIARSSRQIHSSASTIADTVITIPHEVMLQLWDAPDRASVSPTAPAAKTPSTEDTPQPMAPQKTSIPDRSHLEERLGALREQLRQLAGGKGLREALGGSDTAATQIDLIRQIDHLERQLSGLAMDQQPSVGRADPGVAPTPEQPVQVKQPIRSLSSGRRQALLTVLAQMRGISAPRQVLGEIVHQVEQGVFTKLPIPKAINICLHLVRTGRWRTPYGLKTPTYGAAQEIPVQSARRRQTTAHVAGYLN